MYRILLVDDDAMVLRTIRMMFETKSHFEVITATCARDAIASLSEPDGHYDVVITDMRMETSTSGFDVLRAAKSLPQPPLVAILSAFPIPTSDWRGAGADAMFHKGGGAMHMVEDLDRLLSTYRQRNQPGSTGRYHGL